MSKSLDPEEKEVKEFLLASARDKLKMSIITTMFGATMTTLTAGITLTGAALTDDDISKTAILVVGGAVTVIEAGIAYSGYKKISENIDELEGAAAYQLMNYLKNHCHTDSEKEG